MSRIKGDGIYFGASSPGNRSGSRRIGKRHFPHVVQAAASSSLFVTMDAKSGLAACRTQAHLPRRVGIAPHFRFASPDRHRYPPRMVRKSGLGFYPPRHDAPCPTHSCRDLDRETGGMGGRQEIVDRPKCSLRRTRAVATVAALCHTGARGLDTGQCGGIQKTLSYRGRGRRLVLFGDRLLWRALPTEPGAILHLPGYVPLG